MEENKQFKVSRTYLENMIDSIEESILGCDKKGYLNLYNKANEKREGMKKENILGKHMESIYYMYGKPSVLVETIKTGKPIKDHFHEYTVKENGKQFEVIINTVPLFENNKIVGAVATFKDFSQFKKLTSLITELQSSLDKSINNNVQMPAEANGFDRIIGKNKTLMENIKLAENAAMNNLPVLIYGETGTGKELLAKGIHAAGPRKKQPCIALNCAAIPDSLLESILFGTSKGSFTGAVDKPGIFEQASTGTLILDEINSMSPGMQSKLLRVIEEKKVRRVGSIKDTAIDTRLIFIINEDPLHTLNSGKLRKDLYYRIAYLTLTLPPLKERLDDLPVLIEFMIAKYNKELALSVKNVAPELLKQMQSYPWPGNVRELENIIAAGMSNTNQDSDILTLDSLPAHLRHKLEHYQSEVSYTMTDLSAPGHMLVDVEKNVIKQALTKHGWNISQAARELGIKRQNLQHKIKKHAITKTV